MSRELVIVTRYTMQQIYRVPWKEDREPTRLEVDDMVTDGALDSDEVYTDGGESLYGEELESYRLENPKTPKIPNIEGKRT